jgi:hypothetical protein
MGFDTDTANSFPPDLESATNTSGLSFETLLKYWETFPN